MSFPLMPIVSLASAPTLTVYKKTASFTQTLSANSKFAVLIGARFSSSSVTVAAPSVNGVTATAVINRSNSNLGDGHACGIFKIDLGTDTNGVFTLTAADCWIIVVVDNVSTLPTVASGYTNGDTVAIATGASGFSVVGAVNNFSGVGATITNCDSVYSPTAQAIVGVDTSTSGATVTYDPDGTSIQLTVAASFSF